MGLGVALGCEIANPVVITDQKNMIELMRKNIALNELDSNVKELVLNWYDCLPQVYTTHLTTLGVIHCLRKLSSRNPT